MINVTTTSISTTASSVTTTPTVASTAGSSAPSTAAAATESSKPVISYQGTILSNLFDAADEFIRNEHLVPYQGVRYSNGSWGTMKDYEGAYIDVGKYNNYLFDKAATSLVAQAKEKGIELDVKDVVAQLKANNAEIAEMKLDDQKRRELLGPAHVMSRLSWFDVQAFTDMYITAKENSMDVFQVRILASSKGGFSTPGITWIRSAPPPDLFSESTLNLAEEIRGRLTDFFGIGREVFNFILDPELSLGPAYGNGPDVDVATRTQLDFLTKLLDLKDKGLYYSSQNHDSFLNKAITQDGDSSQR